MKSISSILITLLTSMCILSCVPQDTPSETNPTYIQYCTTTKAKPFTLCVVGDGFIAEDLTRNGAFESAAICALDAFFTAEPYRSYKEYFNAYYFFTESAQRGSDIYEKGDEGNVDTYFDTGWDTQTRIIQCNSIKVFDYLKDNCPDLKNGLSSINNTAILVICNDHRYGGTTHLDNTYSTNAAIAIVPLAHNKLDITEETLVWVSNYTASIPGEKADTTYGTWANIALHELGGHAIGRLQDEYWLTSGNSITASGVRFQQKYHSAEVPFGLNVALVQLGQAKAPWYQNWIARPHSEDYKVGFWEGAYNFEFGLWRPERVSCMDDDRFYFNAPSRELIVRRILSNAGETFNFEAFLRKDSNIDYSPVIAPPFYGSKTEGPIEALPTNPSPQFTLKL